MGSVDNQLFCIWHFQNHCSKLQFGFAEIGVRGTHLWRQPQPGSQALARFCFFCSVLLFPPHSISLFRAGFSLLPHDYNQYFLWAYFLGEFSVFFFRGVLRIYACWDFDSHLPLFSISELPMILSCYCFLKGSLEVGTIQQGEQKEQMCHWNT